MGRDYHETLQLLGLRPWLDEKDLLAGDELHRALQQGMKESCAAVFFTAHGMRGLHSTLALEHDASAHVVASSLGHESFSTTA